MNEENWARRNEILIDVAQAIATAQYSIGHGDYVMPDGTRRTAKEYWEQTLTEEERGKFLQQAYRAYNVFGGYGYETVMSLAFEEYVDEK
jgi:hypothetical protein